MSDILSQEEIDALLRNNTTSAPTVDQLSEMEIDALGEIGNISMGSAATALFTILKRKVNITTPEVSITSLRKLSIEHSQPSVAVEILYTEGLKGNNLLIVNEKDVMVITDLMLGGNGTDTEGELTEMHISAISEVMNQMVGCSSTSLSSLLNININISPPKAVVVKLNSIRSIGFFDLDEPIVKINFKMEVENALNSYIMQLLPISFAKTLVDGLLTMDEIVQSSSSVLPAHKNMKASSPLSSSQSDVNDPDEMIQKAPNEERIKGKTKQVDVQPVTLQELHNTSEPSADKENIDLILDVSLEISVELGRTKKLIKEILDLNSGSIIELDKTAGEPVDILVNGKMIAKGEVVVIDDRFGVRITEIMSPIKRIMKLK